MKIAHNRETMTSTRIRMCTAQKHRSSLDEGIEGKQTDSGSAAKNHREKQPLPLKKPCGGCQGWPQ